MIKVFQVVECGGPGATGDRVAALCGGLDPARFEVSVVYAVRSGSPEEYRARCSGAKAFYHVPEMTREIALGTDAAALRKLHRLFAEHRPAVVHAHSSKAGVLARAAAKSAGVPKVLYTPHGYGFLMAGRPKASRALYRMIERAASRVGEVVAASPSEADEARRLAPRGRVHLVPDAYLGGFPEPLPHDDLVVGSRGRMDHAADPDAWVLLAQRLCDSRNGVKCAWLGGGEGETNAKTHLTNMNLLMKVTVTGPLAPDAEREGLRGLDVFVRYSRADATADPFLDAMAAGLPVVASDTPGARDAVIHGVTGFLVKSEVELLERCQELLDDDDLRRRLGAAGRERVRNEFSRERWLASLSELYAA